MSKLYRIKFYISYILISALIIALSLEGIVRLIKIAPILPNNYNYFIADKKIPYKPRPLSVISGVSPTGEFEFSYKHNEMGFRDVEHTVEKPEGVFRILGLGDSFTYGVGASFEETYLYRLEEILNARQGNHKKIEIIKAGIPGFFPEAERLLLEYYGVKYKPDLITVGFLPNDVADTFLGIDDKIIRGDGFLITRVGRKLGKLGAWLYINSHVGRIVLSKYIANIKKRNLRATVWQDIYRSDGYHERDWRKIESEYEIMIQSARKINAQIVFIHIPQNISFMRQTADYPASRLASWAIKNDTKFIDTLPLLRSVSENKQLYWEKDGHCNSNGYTVIAETIAAEIKRMQLIP